MANKPPYDLLVIMPHPKTKPAETDATILMQILNAQESFVSGSVLAETINTTRVSIWGHLDKLRKEGFEFQAIRNRGYRIETMPSTLHGSLLQAYLNILKVAAPLVFFEKIDSTNSEAERQITSGIDTPAIIIAQQQTKGRGRHGRFWASRDSGNLHISFAFKPNLPPHQMQTLSLWIAVCACDFLKTKYELPTQVKWPNDLLLNSKKVAGFLAEARVDANHIRDLVFGIGLNINGKTQNWPTELQAIATSLSTWFGKEYNMNEFTAQFIQCIINAYNYFISKNHQERLNTLWKSYDCLYKKKITVNEVNKSISGKALGIDDEGCLRLLQSDGSIKKLHAGEVSLSQHIKVNY